jgi:hypothetical protein
MTKNRRKSKDAEHHKTSRKSYAAPRLVEFGPVGALTQAGSGATSEIMGNGMASMSPNQRA